MTTARQHEQFLCRLAMNDEATLRSLLGDSLTEIDCVQLGAKTCALVRVAALIAIEAHATTYQWGIGAALAAGASEDDVVDVLVALAPVVGSARVALAAPAVAGALDYHIDAESP